jgi:uncharacterized OB-fold protein
MTKLADSRSATLDTRCDRCGYQIATAPPYPRCPMCGTREWTRIAGERRPDPRFARV